MLLTSKIILLTVIGYALPEHGQLSENPMQDGNLPESDEHLTWELVGEYVQDLDNITADDDIEEKLKDAGDPPMLTEDLCLKVFMELNRYPSPLGDLKLDHILNVTQPMIFKSCVRSSLRANRICRGTSVRYRTNRFCCPSSKNIPILSRRRSLIRCRCLESP
ncbi:uncharacterized protein [Palaemon carinicauda]